MTPDEESCFCNLLTCAYTMVNNLPPGDEELLALRAAADACTQATARAAEQTEAPEKPGEAPAPELTEGPISVMRTRIEAAGSRHLNKLSPPGVIPTTGQYIEALTAALAPVLVELGSLKVKEVYACLDTLTKRSIALDGEIGLFATRIHGKVTALAGENRAFSESIAELVKTIGESFGTASERLTNLEKRNHDAAFMGMGARLGRLERRFGWGLEKAEPLGTRMVKRTDPPASPEETKPDHAVAYTKAEIDSAKANPIVSAEEMSLLARQYPHLSPPELKEDEPEPTEFDDDREER